MHNLGRLRAPFFVLSSRDPVDRHEDEHHRDKEKDEHREEELHASPPFALCSKMTSRTPKNNSDCQFDAAL